MRKPVGIGKKAWSWNKHLKPEGKRMANKSERKRGKMETRISKPWLSCAEWPESVYSDPDGSHVSKDGHDTEGAANGVCRLLEREGFGGSGQHFPVKTWVEELQEWEVKGDHPILKRPDKKFTGANARADAQDYAGDLFVNGYENITCVRID